MTDEALNDRFVLKEAVASGAMGTVYHGWDLERGEAVAIKLLHAKSPNDERRFVHEAEFLAQLSHASIVKYVTHGKSRVGERFIAMEWLEGETLESRLLRRRLTPRDSVAMALQVLGGLRAAHALGVVHRDIKPGNLFLLGGAPERAKIMDFGIAFRLSDRQRLTNPGTVVGTPLYMSPEQASGDSAGEPKSDIFAAGCVLYECLIGQAPFSGVHAMAILAKILLETPLPVGALRPELPESIEKLVGRMLAKQATARPDAGACIRELTAIQDELAQVGEVERPSARLEAARPRALPATREQRVLCVVLVGPEPSTPQERASAVIANSRTTAEDVPLPGIEPQNIGAALLPYGARLDRLFDGSMVLTLSGSFAPSEQALGAARCAVTLRALLPRCAIALATGRVVLGDELPFGAVIDAGARLLDGSEPGVIRLDEATAALLDGRFEVVRAPSKLLLGDEGRDEEEPRTLLGKVTPTVGRERDVELLERVFDDCRSEPSARAVLVKGPAGGGKSRLRHELLQRLRQQGASFELLWGRADSMQGASPFGLLAPALRKAAGIEHGDPIETRREKVRTAVRQYVRGDKANRVSAFMGELMGVAFADSESLVLAAARQEPRLMADQILAAWLDWLEAVSSVRPVLIVLEDLHSGDLPSVQLVDAALRALDQRPLLVLGLARPEIDQRFPSIFAQRELVSLYLGKLTKKACERLVEEVLGDRLIAEKRAWLVDRADGNAFYLEELIRAVAVGAPDAELPDTVLGMVQARLDALGDDGKRVLRAASVFGETFRDDGIRALLGGPRCQVGVELWLSMLAKQEMIFAKGASSQGEYGFRHTLLRDAAYATLTEEDRALGHRLAAEWLETGLETQAFVLAEHFERGRVPERAAVLYCSAAEKALEANDLSLVIRCADRGVEQGATGEVLAELAWRKAEAHHWKGESTEAEAASLDSMQSVATGGPAWFRAAGTYVMASCRRGNAEAAVRVAEDMLALSAHDKLDSARMISMALAAADVMLLGRVPLAEALIERVKQESDSPAFERARGNVSAAEAMVAIVKFSDPSSCLKHARAALATFERAHDVRSRSWQLVNVGYALLELGVYAEAETALREAAALADRIGIAPIAASARQNLGMALFFQGALDRAEITLASAMEAFRAQCDMRQEGTCRMYMARLLCVAGRPKHAEAEAKKAIELFANFPAMRTTALATLSCALTHQSMKKEALESARAAKTLLETMGSVEGESFVRLVHARALHDAGREDEARAALAEAARRVAECARAIADPVLRQSFLDNVPDNRDVLMLAAHVGDALGRAPSASRILA
jgi:serine/threonine protein kinase/tetratricopeptide (TPR) repeat protein